MYICGQANHLQRMKNLILTLFISHLALFVFGQDSIQNILTSDHHLVSGNKVYLIPPAGFTIASNFKGFQHNESGSSIMVVEMPVAISEIAHGFTKKALLSKGIEVSTIDTVYMNDLFALRISGKQASGGVTFQKEILLIGSDKETALINCASPDEFDKIQSEIASALRSVIFDDQLAADPRDGIDFEINEDSSRFVFAQGMMLNLIYSYDGLNPTKDVSKTVLIIGKSFREEEIEDRKLFCLNRFKQTPYENQGILSVEPITLDSISGYAITATGISPTYKLNSTIYQVILFSDNMYYMFLGSTVNDVESNLKEIRKAIASFRRI